ncbi:hypothetical protein GCM10007874_39080 [Labrys miyagiensis]|uniref:Uncharacterized protein n=1 Tax=Labrys miyagiensis TaxID=346912 RepID=A0ABQ6CKM0_9HYPH|nr:hypothetical protein [Labrys miyagiensis]GLS20891.1 hypothetical protein GCM10007874_39080 [Labrys miyagiensis]
MVDNIDDLTGDGGAIEAPVLTSLLRLASPPCGGFVLAEFHFDGNTVLKVPISSEAAEALHTALGIWLASEGPEAVKH